MHIFCIVPYAFSLLTSPLLCLLLQHFIRNQLEKTIAALRERMEQQQSQAAELRTKYNLQDAEQR